MMTGSGIITPVFARRLGELGSGVEALGLMTMSFALIGLVVFDDEYLSYLHRVCCDAHG